MSLTRESITDILKTKNIQLKIYKYLCKYVSILLNEKDYNFLHLKENYLAVVVVMFYIIF